LVAIDPLTSKVEFGVAVPTPTCAVEMATNNIADAVIIVFFIKMDF
jgi:hypothetical protein